MNKKYYIAPAVAVEHVENENLCAASGGSASEEVLSPITPSGKGDAGEACGKIQINDVWE